MKISLCMNTARKDYPIVSRPELHLFELLISSLRKQKFTDFELVIADVAYDTRPDYFKDHKEKFPITHVPSKPNVWTKNKLLAISATKNTCLMYAKGQYVVFIDDCGIIAENYLKDIYALLIKGNVVNSAYFIIGKADRNVYITPGLRQGFNNIAGPMGMFEAVNGYNELFDGGRGWEDEDMMRRMLLANNNVGALNYNPIVYYAHHYDVHGLVNIVRSYCTIWWRRYVLDKGRNGIEVANTALTPEDLAALENSHHINCEYKNPNTNKCKYIQTCLYHLPKNPKRIIANEKESKRINSLYKHPSLVFNLKEQRRNPEKAIKVLYEQIKNS